ncbi:MAG: hypothetical protein RBS68_09630 [Anaerolineales bacterium]|nr:hypothetical protein [Anaerolineales bacterium]
MTDNKRVTRECAIADLDEVLRKAIYAHLAEHQIGEIKSSVQMCCETTSMQKKKSVFGGSEKALQAALLTEDSLIWAEKISGKPVSAGSAKLTHIDMRDYENTAMFDAIADMGVNITGRYTDPSQTGQLFIALDAGPAGKKFRELLREAIKNSKK